MAQLHFITVSEHDSQGQVFNGMYGQFEPAENTDNVIEYDPVLGEHRPAEMVNFFVDPEIQRCSQSLSVISSNNFNGLRLKRSQVKTIELDEALMPAFKANLVRAIQARWMRQYDAISIPGQHSLLGQAISHERALANNGANSIIRDLTRDHQLELYTLTLQMQNTHVSNWGEGPVSSGGTLAVLDEGATAPEPFSQEDVLIADIALDSGDATGTQEAQEDDEDDGDFTDTQTGLMNVNVQLPVYLPSEGDTAAYGFALSQAMTSMPELERMFNQNLPDQKLVMSTAQLIETPEESDEDDDFDYHLFHDDPDQQPDRPRY